VGTQLRQFEFFKKRCAVSRIARSPEPKEKRRKRERELENPHGAIRLKAIAAALEHRRWRDNSSPPKNKSRKDQGSVGRSASCRVTYPPQHSVDIGQKKKSCYPMQQPRQDAASATSHRHFEFRGQRRLGADQLARSAFPETRHVGCSSRLSALGKKRDICGVTSEVRMALSREQREADMRASCAY